MEHGSFRDSQDKDDSSKKNGVAKLDGPNTGKSDRQGKHHKSPDIRPPYDIVNPQGGTKVNEDEAPENMNPSGDVNMEATIAADDVVRAGGFGARDDISSFLPVASDWTDFESSLRDAREYEDPERETCRPGLGWSGVSK